MNNNHQYIIFSENPKLGSIPEVVKRILGSYFHGMQTLAEWKKDKRFVHFDWVDNGKNKQQSKPTNYHEIILYIKQHGQFDISYFNLPNYECFWLDVQGECKINFHCFDEDKSDILSMCDGNPQIQYGKDYPIHPKLTREGHFYSTFQPQLLKRIVSLRTQLVNQSNYALTDEWIFNLRSLISDTISLVEITLNQIYIKAEYDPLETWKFDKEKLGERYGRRFKDKFHWVYEICGKPIDAEKYMPSFTYLRKLRNHMMHFDPPSLVITIEEATIWLNYIIDVGFLLIRVRDAIGAQISIDLLNFVLQKEAIFNPEEYYSNRIPIDKTDYVSSEWP